MTDSVQVQRLKSRYKASFPEKSEEIGSYLEPLSIPAPSSAMNLVDAREFLHKLAGSSGMYGYPDIAEAARAAMRDIDQQSISELLEKLTRLRNLLDRYA